MFNIKTLFWIKRFLNSQLRLYKEWLCNDYSICELNSIDLKQFSYEYFCFVFKDISLIDGMGQHIGMTGLDIQRLNAMYQCEARVEN